MTKIIQIQEACKTSKFDQKETSSGTAQLHVWYREQRDFMENRKGQTSTYNGKSMIIAADFPIWMLNAEDTVAIYSMFEYTTNVDIPYTESCRASCQDSSLGSMQNLGLLFQQDFLPTWITSISSEA